MSTRQVVRAPLAVFSALVLVGLMFALLTPSPHLALAQETSPNQPQAPLACEPDGVQTSGAAYRICMPSVWNRTLVVYAHGYVDPAQPVGIPEDQLGVPGLNIPNTVTFLGYAFATSGYSVNGLAVQEGMADLKELVEIFTQAHGAPDRVLLIGVSEGGLITALSVEQFPEVYDGGLAICGPLGGFQPQVGYFGDFRAAFDYFFPDLLPGSPISIPTSLMADWDNVYTNTVRPVILDPTNADTVSQLLAVTGAATDPAQADSAEKTIERLLWYNVSATNDAAVKLGGNPYSNTTTIYAGSADDTALNAGIARFSADPGVLGLMEAKYTPTGKLSVPLVTAHTTLDPVVPYFHEGLYAQKVRAAGSQWRYASVVTAAYGHCTLSTADLLGAFAELESRVTLPYRLYVPVIQR